MAGELVSSVIKRRGILKKLTIAALSVLMLSACGNNPPAGETTPTATTDNAPQAQMQSATQATDTATISPNSKEGVIRIATESTYKPFTYLDSEGKVVGFEADLAQAMCAKMNRECNIISQDWASLITGLQAGKYETIMSGMSVTEERRQAVDFGESYFDNALVFIARKDAKIGVADVDSKNVAVQQATVAASYMQEHHPNATVKTYDRQTSAYQDLLNGRVDFMLSDIGPASDWLKTEQGAPFEVKGDAIDIDDEYAMAFVKGDPLRQEFDVALKAVKDSGEFDKIYANYFDR